MLGGELPDSTVLPVRGRPWQAVELDSAAASILDGARRRSDVPLPQGAVIAVRLEPGGPGRFRVLVDGAEVGHVAAPAAQEAATVAGKIERWGRRETRLTLAVQLPD